MKEVLANLAWFLLLLLWLIPTPVTFDWSSISCFCLTQYHLAYSIWGADWPIEHGQRLSARFICTVCITWLAIYFISGFAKSKTSDVLVEWFFHLEHIFLVWLDLTGLQESGLNWVCRYSISGRRSTITGSQLTNLRWIRIIGDSLAWLTKLDLVDRWLNLPLYLLG
jgi:hypothetical protein